MGPTAVRRNVFVAAAATLLFVAPFTASVALRNVALGVAAAMGAYLVVRGELAIARPIPRALCAALAAWLALAVASIAWTIDPALTANELRPQVGYLAVVIAIFYCGTGDVARWRIWWLALLAGTLAVFVSEGARQALSPALGLRTWDGGVGAYSTHLAIVAPLVLAIAWPAPWGNARGPAVLASALALLFLAAWDTGNRIVWASFFASLVVALLARRVSALGHNPGNGFRSVAIASLIAIVVLFAVSAWQRDGLFPRNGAAAPSLQADLRPRIWAAAWEQWRAAPWLGHGLGREIVARQLSALTPPGHPDVQHAHNLFLNVALQLGAIGLALFVAVLAFTVREFVAGLREPASAPAAILGLSVLAGFVVKNLTDDFMHRHNALVFWAVIAALLALARTRRGAP